MFAKRSKEISKNIEQLVFEVPKPVDAKKLRGIYIFFRSDRRW